MDNFNIYKKLNETGGSVKIHDDNEWYQNHSNTGWKNNMTDMNNIGTISHENE